MPTINSSNIPAPKSWDEFEDITLSAAKIRWKSASFFRNGRQGQKQNGVDICGTSSTGEMIGIQCKNTINGITLDTVNSEIGNAASFTPPLAKLYIATTAPRDSSIQQQVRLVSEARISNGQFPVDLLFWSDISSDISEDEPTFFKHYPQFSPRNLSTPTHQYGHAREEILRARNFINYISPLTDYLRQMGGEVAHRIDDSPLEKLSDIANSWPITNLRSFDQEIAEKQDELSSLLAEIYSIYNPSDYHSTGVGIIFTWKEDHKHNASLDERKDFARAKIIKALSILSFIQTFASTKI